VRRRAHHGSWPFPVLLLSLCLAQALQARGLLDLSLARIAARAWSADAVSLSLEPLGVDDYRLHLRLGRLHLPAIPVLQRIDLRCPHVRVTGQRLSCTRARLGLHGADGRQLSAVVALEYHRDTRVLRFHLSGLDPFPGDLRLEGHLRGADWFLRLTGTDLDLAALPGLLSPLTAALGGIGEVAGKATLQATISGHGAIPTRVQLGAEVRDMAFNGVNVAEAVNAGLELDCRRAARQRCRVALELRHGGVYIEPGLQLGAYRPGFTLQAGARPLRLDAQLDAPLATTLGRGPVYLKALTLEHPGVMDLRLSGLWDQDHGARPEHLELHLQSPDLARLYAVYLQPLWLNTALSTLETSGALNLDLELGRDAAQRVRLKLDDVYADDEGARFRVSGLSGVLAFTTGNEPLSSRLHWDGAGVYRLDFGATELPMVSRQGRLELTAPVSIPILDGELRVARLRLGRLAQGDADILLDGELTPVSLQELTQALGWPLMSGTLSGRIPGLHYGQGDLQVHGELEVEAFDGRIGIRNLRLQNLFGPVPVLDADISIQGLDLARLTRTFSFGGISGRLDGAIEGLRLEAWQPLRFDAWLATPDDDDSRHRISQRAVDNLTRIGGGATTSAISRAFLGVFKAFDYDRLGLRCRLRNGICQMDGVAPAKSGYYIVEHGLLPPWLDIIGYNRSVNWEVLVERLRAIVQGQAPVMR